jgi:hypothetical protein
LGGLHQKYQYDFNEGRRKPMKMRLKSRAIDKVYKRRDRIDMPDYQREEVWSVSKKQLLIDSILKGWHLPKLYSRKVEENSFECVDGQQRLSAIFEFFDDRLPLSPETASKLNATKYSELSDDISDNFDDFEIEIEEIEDSDDSELEELFRRLQLGTPLNTAENLNAISGDMRNFCHTISRMSFFANKIPLRNTRYAHFEIATRWVFIEARGIQPQVRYPQLEGFLKENRSFSSQSETAKRTIRSLEYLDAAFPEKCRALRSRANVLSVCMLAANVVAQQLDKNTAKVFGNFVNGFFDDLANEVEKGHESTEKELLRYQQAISVGSADGPSIKARSNILAKRLAMFSPEFASLLGLYTEVENEAIKNLNEIAESVKEMVFAANRKYQGANGEDLFKMTTESVAGLNKLGAVCKDSVSFGDFVDALYFIIYEGSGSCKRLPTPPPDFAMDVKFLRTSFRHDVDHGDPSEVKKKLIRNADVFKKYSGKVTLGECSPEEILLTQLRIMEEAVVFLKALA